MRQNKQQGFTLIELLVVVAIIALLAAILFPVFGRVREKARQSSCASNLRQVGLGIMQYVQDNDEFSPSGTYPYEAYANYGAGWAVQVQPYVKAYGVFRCPDDTKVRSVTNYISYAGNANYFGLKHNQAGVVSPSRTVTLTEIQDFPYTLTDTYKYDQCPTWNGLKYKFRADVYNNQWGAGSWSSATGWLAGYSDGDEEGVHSSGSNYLFADGHVKWLMSKLVSPGQNAASSTSAQVNGDYGNAAGTEVMTYAATFSLR